jgi:hypothetical protein
MMEKQRVLIIGNIDNKRTAIMYNALCDRGFDVTIQERLDEIDGYHIDYFLLDEAPKIDRNIEKIKSMNLCPEVMVPNMFEYAKESPSKRNQNRGYWHKGRW